MLQGLCALHLFCCISQNAANKYHIVGNAMEDLSLGDFHHMPFGEDSIDDRGDTASVCSSLSAGLASSKFSQC